MKKEEFLQLLRRALTGDVPTEVVEENIRYYDNYISGEVRKGIPEEEVIAEIGDPRLIAKTIEDTTEGTSQAGYTEPEEDRSGYSSSGQYSDSQQEQRPFGIHTFNLSKWYWKLILMVVVVGFFYLLFMIIGGIFTILSPLLGPLLIIWIVVSLFKSINRR